MFDKNVIFLISLSCLILPVDLFIVLFANFISSLSLLNICKLLGCGPPFVFFGLEITNFPVRY